MSYDQVLADRIRALLRERSDVTERQMLGGLAFMIGGNMAVGASGQGGLLVRADPDGTAALIASGDATPMEMRGKVMAGWLRVDGARVRTTRQLDRWVRIGTTYAASLPPK